MSIAQTREGEVTTDVEGSRHLLESDLRVILDSTTDGILAVDDRGATIAANRRFVELWRIPRSIVETGNDDAMLAFVLDQLVDPEAFLRRVKALYGTLALDMDMLFFKDERVFERYSAPLVRDGAAIGRVWSFRDVTQRRLVEERQREALSNLRALVENVRQGVVFKDREGRVQLANRSFCDLFGVPSPEAILGQDCTALAKQAAPAFADPEGFLAGIDQRLADRTVVLAEELKLADGRTFERDFIPVSIDDVPYGSYWIYRDISERRRTDDQLRQSEEFVRSVLDTVDEGFVVVGRDYRIVSANRTFCESVGIDAGAVVGRHCYELSHRSPRPCFEAGCDCAVQRTLVSLRPELSLHQHDRGDGSATYVETRSFPLRNASGEITSVIETIQDVTARHLLEAERLKVQKLDAIGTLAGGIAHDFNNLLQGVFGYISMAKLKLGPENPAFDLIEQAEKALQMSVNLTGQLLTFSKGGKPIRKLLALSEVIEDSARFALSGSRCDHRLTMDDDLWPVEADRGQIGQVIQNITLNARAAMSEGGTVTITACNVNLPPGSNPSHPDGGRFVRIAISDTGTGIPERHLTRIFDPYFTTKQTGTGLGLATSYSIVKNHGGTIEVESKEGVGSTFTIHLPAVDLPAPASARSSVPRLELPPSRKARILVMDDESIVREVVGDMLASMDHEVEFAEDGAAAIDAYRAAQQAGAPFDLVILDLTVRHGMGGGEAMTRLRELDPAVVAVVSSGYSEDALITKYAAHGFRAFLSKPFDLETLGSMLDSVLE